MHASCHGPNRVCRVCPFHMLYRHCSMSLSSSTDRMLLRLIFISVNTGLSSALFAFLSVILVRLDTLLTQRFPNSHRSPSGSSSYTRQISFSQPCITHSARCTVTRSSRASTCVRSSEVAVRHGNSTHFRRSYGEIPPMRTRARNGRWYSSVLRAYTLSADPRTTHLLSDDATFGLSLCSPRAMSVAGWRIKHGSTCVLSDNCRVTPPRRACGACEYRLAGRTVCSHSVLGLFPLKCTSTFTYVYRS